MSRAFVDEDAGSDEADGMHDIPLPLPSGARNYMTPKGAMKLAEELRTLTEAERPGLRLRSRPRIRRTRPITSGSSRRWTGEFPISQG